MKPTNAALVRRVDLQCDQLGLVLANRLLEGMADPPHHIAERLKAARHQAVAQRRVAVRVKKLAPTPLILATRGPNTLRGSDEGIGWSRRWIAALPVVALLAGLLTIGTLASDSRDAELADVDTALLTDDLPPAAYTDPGFLQFLKSSREPNE